MTAREATHRYGATGQRAAVGFATALYTIAWDTILRETRLECTFCKRNVGVVWCKKCVFYQRNRHPRMLPLRSQQSSPDFFTRTNG
jgi:hypothetical protein